MIHNKRNFQKKKKFNNEHLSKSIQSKTNNTNTNTNSNNSNVRSLKRASSGLNFVDKDTRNNKTINLDNKWEFFIKNKSFISSSELNKNQKFTNSNKWNEKRNKR